MARVGHVCNTVLGKMLQTTPKTPGDQEVPYLRAGLLETLSDLAELPTMFARDSEVRTLGLREGDLIVAEGGDVGRSEMAPRLPQRTIFQNSLHRIRLRAGGDIRFVRYALSSIYSSGWLDVLCNRATFGHLTVEKLRQLHIPWPRPSQQTAVADYLDTETSHIDTLITKKRRMIELLEERMVNAARALTSGHGHVAPLRRFARAVKTGTTPPARELDDLTGEEVSWYAPGDVGRSLEMLPPARGLSRRAVSEGWTPEFPPDSTLIVGIGATAGRVGHNVQAATGNQQITCITSNSRVLPRFLSWQLWAREDELRETAPYTTLPILNNDFLRSLPISAPPVHHQQDIVNRLDRRADQVQAVTERLRAQIDLLAERRQALITAAVAGELAVSGGMA